MEEDKYRALPLLKERKTLRTFPLVGYVEHKTTITKKDNK
jgi:hypothetical protein